MEAKELRLGNLVQIHDKEQRVISVCEQYIETKSYVSYFSDNINIVKPIPLTEEWLLKLGFKNLSYGFERNFDLDFCIRLIISDGWYYPQLEKAPEMSNEDMQIVGVTRIKHVHSLQNLVFYTVGEELTPNP